MEKRACERIPVNMEVQFYCCNKAHNGTAVNVSEKGMFLKTTDICFPIESQLEVEISYKEKVARFPVNLRRMEMSPDSHDGIGVEVSGPSDAYAMFIDSLRSSL